MAPRPVAASQVKSVQADLAAIGGNRPFTERFGDAVKAFGSVFFGPLVPSTPSKEIQAEGPRRWPFMPGYNAHITPRGSEGLTPFSTLVNISQLYDTAAMCILYRVEEISAMDWTVVDLDPKHPASDQEKADYAAFLAKPDGITQLEDWLAALVEEVLVTDALSIYLPRSRTNQVLGFELVDGTTIRTLADGHGRQPQPPSPSHQQIINGRIAWEGTSQDFLYAPKNRRVRSLYGRSPTENLVLGINRALRRQVFDLAYYAEGNIPEALVPVGDLTPDQLDDLQAWFDGIAGQPEQVRRVHLIPATTGKITPFEFKRPILDEKIELFLDKRCMAMYGITSGSLGFDPGTQGTGALQENVSYQRSIALTRFVRRIIHALMTEYRTSQPSQAFGGVKASTKKWNCRIQLKGEEPEEDKVRQSSVDHTYWSMGKTTVNELRKRDGEDPIEGLDDPFLMLPTGPVDLKLALQAAQGNHGMPPAPTPPPGKVGPDGKPVNPFSKNPTEAPGQGAGSDKEAPGERSDDGKPASGMPSAVDTTSLTRYSEDQPRQANGEWGTSEERQAEIKSLQTEHHAVLMTPLMSTGEISPMQVGMMSKNEHARYMENTMQKMDIEARIRQLSKSDEELAKDKNTASVRDLKSRQTQLVSQIEMWDRLSQNKYRGVTGSVKSKAATHERLKTELADVRAKITTLDPKGLVRVDESGDEGTQLLRTVNSWLERDISTSDGLTNHDLQGGTPTPPTGGCGCPEGEPCDCGADCPDCGPDCCPQGLERSSVDPLPLPTQPYMTNSAGKRIHLPGDVTDKLNVVIQEAAEGGFSGVTLVGSFANGDSDKGGEGTSDIDVLLHPLGGQYLPAPSGPMAEAREATLLANARDESYATSGDSITLPSDQDGEEYGKVQDNGGRPQDISTDGWDCDSRARSVEDSLNTDGRPVEISVGPYLSIDMEGWTPCYVTLWGSTDVQAASDMVGDQPKVGPPIGYPSPATGPVDAVSRRAEVTVDSPNVPTGADEFGTTDPDISRAGFFTDEEGIVHPIRGSEGYSDEKGGGGKGEGKSKSEKKTEPAEPTKSFGDRIRAEIEHPDFNRLDESHTTRIGGLIQAEIDRRVGELPALRPTDEDIKAQQAKCADLGQKHAALAHDMARYDRMSQEAKVAGDDHKSEFYAKLAERTQAEFEKSSELNQTELNKLTGMWDEQRKNEGKNDERYHEVQNAVLAEIRPMGNPDNLTHNYNPGSHGDAKIALEKAMAFYPKEWNEASVKRAEAAGLTVSKLQGGYYLDRQWSRNLRAFTARLVVDENHGSIFTPLAEGQTVPKGGRLGKRDGQIGYTKADPLAVMEVGAHEYGHRMEASIPGIRQLEKQFYDRRTAGSKLEKMGYARMGGKEVTRKDQFIDPYIGKDYVAQYGSPGAGHYEVFSMAMERVAGRDRGLRGDRDYHAWTLGVLATSKGISMGGTKL